MSFTFEARTLLELGKELISSDEVALYELIKNSIDANSPTVEILVNLQLTHSSYEEALAQLREEKKSVSSVFEFIEKSLIDKSNEDAEWMLEELEGATDRDDFEQKLIEVYNEINTIEVRDAGSGMSIHDLSNVFLRIGTKSRHRENLEGAKNLGDKGIGRLSTMRLGNQLQVKTSEAGEAQWNMLDIDWTRFADEEVTSIDEIVIEPYLGEEKHNEEESGTSILISALNSDWDFVRFTDVLQGRIARMIDPFARGRANKLIVPRHNGSRVSIPSIPKKLLDAAHAVCHVDFAFEGDEPVLSGFVDYRYRHRRTEINQRGAEVLSLGQETVKRRAKRGHAAFKLLKLRLSTLQKLGPFSCDIYWFNRRVVEAVDGLSAKPAETRREISHWSGGPMLYRYGYRILPYGDPGDDWLNLDEAAFGASGFKLNRQQVIGRVLLETPHSTLGEQTNREGFVQSDVSDALRKIMMWIVHVEMRGLINEADKIEKIERRAAEHDTKNIQVTRERVELALSKLEKFLDGNTPDSFEDLRKGVIDLSTQSSDLVDRIEKVIEEADAEREKFVYLAGIGLMTEFIFHELERAVQHTMDLLSGGALRKATTDSLREQLKTLHKRIAAFDELTGEKRQSKSKFDLSDLVDEVLSNHSKEFERHGIEVRFDRPTKSYEVRAVRGMVIQILENLIVNSAYWLKQQKGYQTKLKPQLEVVLDSDTDTITIEDNGPGVPKDRSERIFQPFITSKPTGQGRGLGLYIARDLAEYHGWTLKMDDEVGRIRKGRINMFVLDMGDA